jgi:Flp pilus assembly CpaF family ATPase
MNELKSFSLIAEQLNEKERNKVFLHEIENFKKIIRSLHKKNKEFVLEESLMSFYRLSILIGHIKPRNFATLIKDLSVFVVNMIQKQVKDIGLELNSSVFLHNKNKGVFWHAVNADIDWTMEHMKQSIKRFC